MNVFQEGWINFKSLWTGQKYVGFKGRATRREFWTTQIYFLIFGIAASLLDLILTSLLRDAYTSFSLFSTIWSIVIFLPSLALLFRRLHDAGHSGWWALSSLMVAVFLSIVICLGMALGVFYFLFSYASFNPLQYRDSGLVMLLLLAILSSVAVVVLDVTIFVFTLLKSQSGANKYGEEVQNIYQSVKCDSKCNCTDNCDCKKEDNPDTSKAEEVPFEEVKDDDKKEGDN